MQPVKFQVSFLAFAAASLFLFATAAVAVPLNHGTFVGSTVTYQAVTEDSSTGDTLPLYQPSGVLLNTLDFDPLGFVATSQNGGAIDEIDGSLTLTILANPGNVITSAFVRVGGDRTVAGTGGSETQNRYNSHLELSVTEVDGVAIAPLSVSTDPTQIRFLSNGEEVLGNWGFGYGLNVVSLLNLNGISFVAGATKLELTLYNLLSASSEQNSLAFIAMNDAFVSVETVPAAVPEPATCLLLGSGLFGGLAFRKRKQS